MANEEINQIAILVGDEQDMTDREVAIRVFTEVFRRITRIGRIEMELSE